MVRFHAVCFLEGEIPCLRPLRKRTDVPYNGCRTPVPLNQHLLNWYVKQCSIYFPISSNHAVLPALRGKGFRLAALQWVHFAGYTHCFYQSFCQIVVLRGNWTLPLEAHKRLSSWLIYTVQIRTAFFLQEINPLRNYIVLFPSHREKGETWQRK